MVALPSLRYKDPAVVVEIDERNQRKREMKCAGCLKRPIMVGGNGQCKADVPPVNCSFFRLDEGVANASR